MALSEDETQETQTLTLSRAPGLMSSQTRGFDVKEPLHSKCSYSHIADVSYITLDCSKSCVESTNSELLDLSHTLGALFGGHCFAVLNLVTAARHIISLS